MSQSYIQQKVSNVIDECELHVKRLNYASDKLKTLMPLDDKSYQNLKDEHVESLDQFLFRFSKLQDAIGQRLFSGLLELLKEPVKQQPFLDRLNRLEQLGVLEDKEQWLQLWSLRNTLSHEYENEPVAMSKAINTIYESKNMLLAIYVNVKKYTVNYL